MVYPNLAIDRPCWTPVHAINTIGQPFWLLSILHHVNRSILAEAKDDIVLIRKTGPARVIENTIFVSSGIGSLC